ncbi:MAG TPA: hypothetical protein VMX79_12915 [bacterium]|nr:hypothetical protein [bacterium]
MDDFQRKLNIKLLDRFAEMLVEVELRPTEKALAEFWKIWNAINGAASRLGLPHDEATAVRRPSPVAIEDFLTRVVAEGSERGGELTL